jgi:hypothetical protein
VQQTLHEHELALRVAAHLGIALRQLLAQRGAGRARDIQLALQVRDCALRDLLLALRGVVILAGCVYKLMMSPSLLT